MAHCLARIASAPTSWRFAGLHKILQEVSELPPVCDVRDVVGVCFENACPMRCDAMLILLPMPALSSIYERGIGQPHQGLRWQPDRTKTRLEC